MLRTVKLCALLLVLCLMTTVLTGCEEKEEFVDDEELHIYASIYPIYALADMICTGVPDAQLHLLIQPQDGCMRSYVLSDWDAALLASADALIVGGEGLESFTGALANGNTLAVAQVLSGMECIEFEGVNMEAEADSHWEGVNPHAYMSVDGAIDIAARIAAAMESLDPKYETLYQSNLTQAQVSLWELRTDIEAEVTGFAGMKCAVLHEALLYTARDCGLEASLCWARESGESLDEGELERLIENLEVKDIHLVLIERQAPVNLTNALRDAGISVAMLDVLSTHREAEGAAAYIEALRSNAVSVREACEGLAQEES